MPFTEASAAARSMAASNSSTKSCPITFMDLPGWSMVRVAIPSPSIAYAMLLVIRRSLLSKLRPAHEGGLGERPQRELGERVRRLFD